MDFSKEYSLKLLLRFFFPVALAAVFENLYSLISVSLTGHILSESAVAVVGACSPVGSFQSSLVNGISFGIGIYLGRCVGSHDRELFKRAFTGSLIAGSALCAVALLLIPAAPVLLRLLSVPQEIRDQASGYVAVVLITTVFLMAERLLMVTLQSFGDARFMSGVYMAGVVLSTFFTWLLIGMMKLPVWGSALSVLLTHLVMASALLIYCMKSWRDRLALVPPGEIGGRVYREILFGGGAKTGMFMLGTFGKTFFQAALNRMDIHCIAGYTYATTLYNLLMAAAWELGTVSGVVTGQNEGSGNWTGIRQYNRALTRIHLLYTAVLLATLFIPASRLIALMAGAGTAPETIGAGERMFRIYLCFAPFLWVVIYRNALQAVGAHGSAFMIGIIHFLTYAAGTYILSYFFGYTGLCMVYPVSWVAQSVYARLRYERIAREKAVKAG